jgi:hypothetical protein
MRTITAGALLLALAAPAPAAEWEAVTTELLKKEKTGFGGLCGVVVDRSMNGDLIVNLSDLGLFLSRDQGKTWGRLAGVEPFKGRTETPGCMAFDPVEGSRKLLVVLVYGAPAGIYGEGPNQRMFDKKCSHVDWVALDWRDKGGQFVLALKHESGGALLASHDGGKSFEEIGKGFGPAWVFDDTTAVAAEMKSKEKPKPGLLRTTDGGKNWKPCGDYTSQALPKWRDGTLYWVVEGALIASSDKGENWKKISDLKDGKYGPIFGKTAKQMFVLTPAGVVESTDGGATWGKPVPLPKELKGWSPLTWLDYDPANDVLYVMKMGTDLFKMARK